MTAKKRDDTEWMLRKRLRDERPLAPDEQTRVDCLQSRMSRYKTLTTGEAAAYVAGLRA